LLNVRRQIHLPFMVVRTQASVRGNGAVYDDLQRTQRLVADGPRAGTERAAALGKRDHPPW
jgi:hypothetical protein